MKPVINLPSTSNLRIIDALAVPLSHLRNQSGWSSATSSLVRSVAAELAFKGLRLSDTMDNEHFLERLHAFCCLPVARLPDDLQPFASRVADIIESEPNRWSMFSGVQRTSANISPSLAVRVPARQTGKQTIVAFSRAILVHLVDNLSDRCLSGVKPLRHFYLQLRDIHSGSLSARAKLHGTADVLDNATVELACLVHRKSMEHELREDLLSLLGHATCVKNWMRIVEANWNTFEDARYVLQGSDDALTKTTELLALLENANRLSVSDRSSDLYGHVVALARTVRHELEQVRLLQTLPANCGTIACLRVLTGSDAFATLVGDSVTTLCRALSQNVPHVPWPAGEDVTRQLSWLMQILADPELAERLQPPLETLLRSREKARTLVGIGRLAGLIACFPAGKSLAGQLHYLHQSLTSRDMQQWLPALSGMPSLGPALAMGHEIGVLLKAMLGERVAGSDVWSLARRAGSQLLPAAATSGMLSMAAQYVPAAFVGGLSDFVQSGSNNESWRVMAARAVPGTLRGITGMLAGWMGVSQEQVMSALQAASYLGQERSLEELLNWFVRQETSADGEARSLQRMYVVATLCLKVWDMYHGSVQEQEQALSQLAEQVKRCGVARIWPALGKLADLMPLAPALREVQKVVRGQPEPSSIAGRLEQWMLALEQSSNPRMLVLLEKLTELAGKWVAEALMPMLDWAASLPTGLLPGATAQPAEEAADAASAQRLHIGGGLGVVGLAMTAWGVSGWLTSGVREADILQGGSLLKEAHRSEEEGETSALSKDDRSTQYGLPHSTRIDRVLPLLGGVVTMAVAGYLLKGWYNGHGNNEATADDITRTNSIVDRLEVPDLGFVFDNITPAAADRQRREAPARKTAVMSRNSDGKIVWRMASPPPEATIEEKEAREFLQSIKTVLGVRLLHIYERAERSGEVRLGPESERRVRHLLKCTQLLSALIDESSKEAPPSSYFQALQELKGLRARLSGENNRRIIDAYHQAYELEVVSVSAANETTESYSLDVTTTDIQNALTRIDAIFSPILDPAVFLDSYLTKKIIDYAKDSGLKPGSRISGRIFETPNQYNGNMVIKTGALSYPQSYTLRELATRHHYYDIWDKRRENPDTSFTYRNASHHELIRHLQSENLEAIMVEALRVFSGDSLKIDALKKHYQAMITVRCLAYLSAPHNPPVYISAVKKFMCGELEAKEVYFHGLRLNGVFIIPTDEYGGVLISVDEPKHFHLAGQDVIDQNISGYFRYRITACPNSESFRTWVLHKIPLKGRVKYEKNGMAFLPQRNGKREILRAGDVPLMVKRRASPLTFENASKANKLSDKLLHGLIERIASDVDSLVLTQGEMIEKGLLDCLKYMLEFLSLAAAVALPGTGSVLGRVLALAAGVGLDVAAAGIGFYQSTQADRLQDAEALRDEAILASVLIGLGLVAETGGILVKSLPGMLSQYQKLKPKIKKQFAQFNNIVPNNNLPLVGRSVSSPSKIEVKPPLAPHSRTMGPDMVKPKRPRKKDYYNGDFFQKDRYDADMKIFGTEMAEYLKINKPGLTSRLDVDPRIEFEKRKNIAVERLKNLKLIHPNLIDSITTIEVTPSFSVVTSNGDTAKTLALNAHGWYTANSRSVLIPPNREVIFLGPHGKTLLEPELTLDSLPTEKLFNGKDYPQIFSKLKKRDSQLGGEYSEFSTINAGIDKDDHIKNYSVKYYDRTPSEELALAVAQNRINESVDKMDILIVNPQAENKSMRDIFNEMKDNRGLSAYDRLVFVACREEKIPVTLQPVHEGLGNSYEVHFTGADFSSQRIKRNASNGLATNQNEVCDGIVVYEKIIATTSGKRMSFSSNFIGFIPFIEI